MTVPGQRQVWPCDVEHGRGWLHCASFIYFGPVVILMKMEIVLLFGTIVLRWSPHGYMMEQWRSHSPVRIPRLHTRGRGTAAPSPVACSTESVRARRKRFHMAGCGRISSIYWALAVLIIPLRCNVVKQLFGNVICYFRLTFLAPHSVLHRLLLNITCQLSVGILSHIWGMKKHRM